MITKHDVGDTVLINGKVLRIMITEEQTVLYSIDLGEKIPEITVYDKDIEDVDCVTTETYETEVNELKSIIEEKNKEIEKLKAKTDYLKDANKTVIEVMRKDFSHHPQENIYAKSLKNFDDEKEYDKEDWRMP